MINRMVLLVLFIMLSIIVLSLKPNVTYADTNVAQSGPNPILFNQTATTDNLIVLLGAQSEHNSGLDVYLNTTIPKHFWIQNFNDTTNDYLQWTISLAAGATYHVDALLSGSANEGLNLTVKNTSNVLNFTTTINGWDKVDAGTIYIPAGISTLKLTRTSAAASIDFKSLELIKDSDRSAYLTRIQNFKKDTTWLSQTNYGLEINWGPWVYPQSGSKKSFEDQVNDFDVNQFVQMVKGTGAKYVIWSATWWTYHISAPISSIDTLVGNGARTSSRDLIGEISTALHNEGIKFMLYYHNGHDEHLGYNSTDWWQAQNWPSTFTATGTGNRTTFINNWTSVITEIGNRYGNNLDGWFFDDGLMYYPAPFEQMGQAARAGNANRLISYNSWIASRYTDFQDVYMGEDSHGEVLTGSASAGGNGIFTAGPNKGLLQQAMFTMEQDWGVHAANQAISTQITANQALSWVNSAKSRGVPLTFTLMMYENGTVAQTSLDILNQVKQAVYGGETTPNATIINDTNSQIGYSGFSYSGGRAANDYLNDVHYATANNSYVQYSFNGSGVDYIGPKDSNYGNSDIYIDGILSATVSAYATSYSPQQTLYSKRDLATGNHTIKVVKQSGTYAAVDAIKVYNPLLLNNTDASISYNGFTYSGNRMSGDYLNDVHYATQNTSSTFQCTFFGTGVEIISPKYTNYGNMDIYIDGVLQQNISTYSTSGYQAQQTVYSVRNLTNGTHTIKGVKTSGSYVSLDAIRIY